MESAENREEEGARELPFHRYLLILCLWYLAQTLWYKGTSASDQVSLKVMSQLRRVYKHPKASPTKSGRSDGTY